jgi:hypothetical protein
MVTAMLVEAAGSVGRMRGKNYLAAQHARLTTRRGMGRAPGRRRALDAGVGLLDAQTRRALHDLGADWHSGRSNEARGVRVSTTVRSRERSRRRATMVGSATHSSGGDSGQGVDDEMLGNPRFAAEGGDLGGYVVALLARTHRKRMLGINLT